MFAEHIYQFFREHLRDYTGNYLEIGVFNGDSIRNLAQAYPNKTIFGIDPFVEDGNTSHTTHVGRGEAMPAQKENALGNIQGIDNITLFMETSQAFARRVTQEQIVAMSVDCVFVDGCHDYEVAPGDLELARRLIQRRGIIAVDDTNLPGPARALAEFLTAQGARVRDLSKQFPMPNGIILEYSNE